MVRRLLVRSKISQGGSLSRTRSVDPLATSRRGCSRASSMNRYLDSSSWQIWVGMISRWMIGSAPSWATLQASCKVVYTSCSNYGRSQACWCSLFTGIIELELPSAERNEDYLPSLITVVMVCVTCEVQYIYLKCGSIEDLQEHHSMLFKSVDRSMEESKRSHGRISEREILQRQGNMYQDGDQPTMPVSGEYDMGNSLRTQIATTSDSIMDVPQA